MITISELWRRVQNMVVTARVEETMASDGKMLVRVAYTDKETGEEHLSKFLPVATKNNSFMKVWMPVLKDEQVTVLRPFGDNDGGIVFTSIYWLGNQEPAGANEHVAIVEFSDGCTIKYDTQSKELSVDSCEKVTLTCDVLECTGSLKVGGTVTDYMGVLSNFVTSNDGTRV